MESRIGVVAMVISDCEAAERVNAVLHDYRDYVIGRMGIPYKAKSVNVISVVLDASAEVLNGLSGKLGMINGVNSKLVMHNAK